VSPLQWTWEIKERRRGAARNPPRTSRRLVENESGCGDSVSRRGKRRPTACSAFWAASADAPRNLYGTTPHRVCFSQQAMHDRGTSPPAPLPPGEWSRAVFGERYACPARTLSPLPPPGMILLPMSPNDCYLCLRSIQVGEGVRGRDFAPSRQAYNNPPLSERKREGGNAVVVAFRLWRRWLPPCRSAPRRHL
jgi:hypothetical protein